MAKEFTEDYWEIEYVITNYNKECIFFVERYFGENGEPTEQYRFWAMRDNPEKIIRERRVDRYYDKHFDQGSGDDGLSLEECFMNILKVVSMNIPD